MRFIEVHEKGLKRLINLDWISEIRESEEGIVTIYFAFTSPGYFDQDHIIVDESYDQLLYIIRR